MTDFEQEHFEPRHAGQGDTLEGQHPTQIERAIERTRERMAHDVDVLSERLAPRNLARKAMNSAGQRARRIGDRVVAFVRANPIPAAVVGLSALWLMARRRRS